MCENGIDLKVPPSQVAGPDATVYTVKYLIKQNTFS